jgi:signal transduction histidine kinase
VAQILSWPYWEAFNDAVISDLNPHGVSLNPVGSLGRGAAFDREGVEWGMRKAVERREPVMVADGRALPIVDARGRAWGGVWFRVEDVRGSLSLWQGLLPWFFASTLLLFFGTFSVLRRYVLQPVGELAAAAQRVRAGDLGVNVDLPAHRDELADLMATFNHMTAEVKGFHDHLEVEVDEAKRKAFEAEAAALRQRRLAAMGELAAGIAHEINNPLGGMLNAVDVLEREGLAPEKRARYLELVRGGLQRIQTTVAGLLRFTPRSATLAAVDLAQPVSDAVALLAHSARKQDIVLRFEDRSGGALVLGSVSELGQAVLNLLSNSMHAIEDRRHTEPGGLIEVLLERSGAELHLTVRDDGCGVPADELERMTDLFYTTKEVGRGTGLGLALVLSVVSQHRGRVLFERRAAGGFSVELVLPVAPPEGELS